MTYAQNAAQRVDAVLARDRRYRTVPALAAEAGVSERTARRRIARLRGRGILETDDRGWPHAYRRAAGPGR